MEIIIAKDSLSYAVRTTHDMYGYEQYICITLYMIV